MKIFPLEKLVIEIQQLKDVGEKIVHCHGVFDLLHIGHIRHFHQAKKNGDILVVTITPDRFVDKGDHRPAFPENLRAEALASLDIVDYVAINNWPTAENTLRLLKPDIYAKGAEFKSDGSDYTSKIDGEKAVASEIGTQIVFTEDIVFSSSNLINRFLSSKPKEIQEYLHLLRERFTLDEIFAVLEKMSSLKVMVIGDTILDDYHYCTAIGKSNKDPVLALQFNSSELFAGGSLAFANNIAGLVDKVGLIALIGEHDDYKDFIVNSLHPNVTPHLVVQPGAPTLIKRRFLDGYSFNKLYEVYIMDDAGLPNDLDRQLCEWVEKEIPGYNLVIAADFGHGAISNSMIETLCKNAPYLAVNTQANAGNRGYHTISRYPRADFVCLAEHEIRLETRDLKTSLRPMIAKQAERLSCSTFIVTRGRSGSVQMDRGGNFYASPSLTMNVVDRVGGGDAFFSIAALAAFLETDEELIGFLGNIVGSLAVGVIGNKKPLDKMSIKKLITSLLK